jgi:hypothetical protein
MDFRQPTPKNGGYGETNPIEFRTTKPAIDINALIETTYAIPINLDQFLTPDIIGRDGKAGKLGDYG